MCVYIVCTTRISFRRPVPTVPAAQDVVAARTGDIPYAVTAAIGTKRGNNDGTRGQACAVNAIAHDCYSAVHSGRIGVVRYLFIFSNLYERVARCQNVSSRIVDRSE